MELEKIKQVTGTAVHVPGDDIDTDRIIPARFMKCVTFDGLGEYAFYDVRFDPETGERTDHNLNDPRFEGAAIMLSGNNFGCGSSREHAPQSLHRAGIRAVVAEGFAEIFFGNSTNLGIPCVTAKGDDIRALAKAVQAEPQLAVTVDIEAQKVRYGDTEFDCEIRPGARSNLLKGRWDTLQELLEDKESVDSVADNLAYMATHST